MKKIKDVEFIFKNVVFDEEAKAIYALETGEIDRKPVLTLRPIIKYLHSIGKNKKQIRQDIEEFMSKNYNNFLSIKWEKALDGLVNTFTKNDIKLIKIDNVAITQAELDYISSLNDIKLEKLAYVILVYYKVKKQMCNTTSSEAWLNFKESEVFKDAKVRTKKDEQSLVIHNLVKIKAIDLARDITNGSVKINYINEESPSVITIDDFREFVLTYLKWKGTARIGKCEICGKLIELKSNKTKYCTTCRKEIDKVQTKKRVQKLRKNDNVTE